jgi:hypothetical protein
MHEVKTTVKLILVAVTIFWVSVMNKLPYFPVDNARVIYTSKVQNSLKKMNMRGIQWIIFW